MLLTNKHKSLMWEMVEGVSKAMVLLVSLYFFIVSLSFLSTGFRIAGGQNIGVLFESELLSSPVVGVMLGVLITVMVQSSSTSTSILVGLVSAGAPVSRVIPMVLGANIGTSVTNTIVALTHIGDKEQFRRAFSCATVHDMFNWLSVILFMTLESFTHYLENLTGYLVADVDLEPANTTTSSPDFLKMITNPITKSVVKLNSKVLEGWAAGDPEYANVTTMLAPACIGDLKNESSKCKSPYLLAFLGEQGAGLPDLTIGLLLALVALVMMCCCLITMVKILNSLLGSRVTRLIKDCINSDLPRLPWLTGYLAIIVGAALTFLLQSSSVFTSTLTPLAGAGLIELKRAYPLTLGSNIGTTTTSIIASMATDPGRRKASLQIALVHLFFNLSGILVFYVVPVFRVPITLAEKLGDTTAQYPWFGGLYLIVAFFLAPGLVFLLSLLGPVVLYSICAVVLTIAVIIAVLTGLQNRCPRVLPEWMRTWEFLPAPLRSLEPYDAVLSRIFFCCRSEDVVGQEIADMEAGSLLNAGRPIVENSSSAALIKEEAELDTRMPIVKHTCHDYQNIR